MLFCFILFFSFTIFLCNSTQNGTDLNTITFGRFNFDEQNNLTNYKRGMGYEEIKDIVKNYTESKIFLVDFDQCLSKSAKYDDYFGQMLSEKIEMKELLKKYNDFCLTSESEFEVNEVVENKLKHFKEENEENLNFIWTARARESASVVQNFLMYNGLDKIVDGLAFTCGNKLSFIETLIDFGVQPQNIFAIDDVARNCDAAKTILPDANVELWKN